MTHTKGMTSLEKTKEQELTSVLTDTDVDSDVMLVAFGGIMSKFGLPIFEFSQMLSNFPVKKIFIRDFSQAWYQGGLTGISTNINETTLLLRSLIRQENVRRVVTIGNSAGGYAALLFGHLLEVDQVLAFSPQTFINWQQRLFHLDFRWRYQIRNVYRISRQHRRYLDLRPLFLSEPRKTKFHIYYPKVYRPDVWHAQHLQDCPKVRLFNLWC